MNAPVAFELDDPEMGELVRWYVHQPSRVRRQINTVRETFRVGRNEPCPCGSGRKFKHCCIHQS